MGCKKVSHLGKTSHGREFEKEVLRVFKNLGFTIDEGLSAKSGELDVIIIDPIRIGVECRASKREVGVGIVDELARHLRRYEEKSGLNDFFGLIVAEDSNRDLVHDATSMGRYLIKASTLAELCKFNEEYPFEPNDFYAFFSQPGEIDSIVLHYLQEKTREYSVKNITKEKSHFQKTERAIKHTSSIPQELYPAEIQKLAGKWILESIYKKLRTRISEFGSDVILKPDDKGPIRFEVYPPQGRSIVFGRVEIKTKQINVDFKINSSTFENTENILKSSNNSFDRRIVLDRNKDELISEALTAINHSYEAVRKGTYDSL